MSPTQHSFDHRHRTRPRLAALLASGAVLAGLLAFGWVPACSLHNQDGPEVSCADMNCGQINACADGIIAQCLDGVTVRYRVCSSDNVCDSDWQIPGQYRCSEDATDCEGCRPERTGCPWPDPGAGGSAGGTVGGGGSTGGAGGAGGATG